VTVLHQENPLFASASERGAQTSVALLLDELFCFLSEVDAFAEGRTLELVEEEAGVPDLQIFPREGEIPFGLRDYWSPQDADIIF
jgi:hypothetical protein